MKGFIIFLALMFANILVAQNFSYFPLSVGNKWFFSDQGFEDVIKLKLEVQKDTSLSDGYLYAKLNMLQVNSDSSFTLLEEGYSYLREENGQIIEYPERLILDYNMNIGDSVISFYNEPYPAVLDTIVNENIFNRDLSTYTFFSTQYDYYSYSDSIGFNTLWATDWHNYYPKYLLGCEIDGKVYGEIVTKLEKNFEGPKSFILFQNFPNPFNPITIINYELKFKSDVNLKVYDIAGREIKILVNTNQNQGHHSFTFDATGLSSGIYIYRLKSGTFVENRKMLLVR